MYVVAIALPSETEGAERLAALVGVSAYDARLWLNGQLPRVVFQSEREDEARNVLSALRDSGYGVVGCHASAVASTAQMVRVRRFAFEGDALWSNETNGQRIELESIGALIHAAVRTDVSRTTREREVMYTRRGGPKVVTKDRTRAEHTVEQALYMFPRDGALPWVLSEGEARYVALGSNMGATRRQSFERTVALLRNKASRAVYDDRFTQRPLADTATVRVQGHDRVEGATSRSSQTDLVIHLLARWLLRQGDTPYRRAP